MSSGWTTALGLILSVASVILAAAQVYYARKGTQLTSTAMTEAQQSDERAHIAESEELNQPVAVPGHSISARSVGLRAVWGPLLLGWAIGMSISRHDYLFYPHFNLLIFLVSIAVMIPLILSPWGRQFVVLLTVTISLSASLYLVLGPWAPVASTITSIALWELRRTYSGVNDILGIIGMSAGTVFYFAALEKPEMYLGLLAFCIIGATVIVIVFNKAKREHSLRNSNSYDKDMELWTE